jgi:hypothetical protein
MRRWFDLPATVKASFNLLKKDNVGVLFTQKGYGTGETDLSLVWVLFVPDLPILHVKGQRAKHRLLPPCQCSLANDAFPHTEDKAEIPCTTS